MKKVEQPDANVNRDTGDKKKLPVENKTDKSSTAKKYDGTYKLEDNKKKNDHNSTLGIP